VPRRGKMANFVAKTATDPLRLVRTRDAVM
jgi:hypothetical protein